MTDDTEKELNRLYAQRPTPETDDRIQAILQDEVDHETDECPEHGEQRVTGSRASAGSDPYNINKLACGHEVICMGPGESNYIV